MAEGTRCPRGGPAVGQRAPICAATGRQHPQLIDDADGAALSHVVAMLAAIRSAAIMGVESYDVTVEVDSAPGLPHFAIVGLPAGSVKESRERVYSAIVNSGFRLPARRITVNLAPADMRKDGTAFDLPIAVGVLAASGQLRSESPLLGNAVLMGELGLDGTLRPVRGVLSVARRLSPGRQFVVPPANAAEAMLARSVTVVAPSTLGELVSGIDAGRLVPALSSPVPAGNDVNSDVDFAEVAGQDGAKRALEIAAAGGHAVLLVGPPGAGKTMLARRLPGILPTLSEEEALEVVAIQSVAGLLSAGVTELPSRPFRAPHHTVSSAGLIGGGSAPRPGEVSLAHHGVLFLDEMLEFPRHVLDGLRQPLEDGKVVISRASMSVSYPSRFTMVGAMNPCLCGRAGTQRSEECCCTESVVKKYRSRISGPLRDRIDMQVSVGAVALEALSASRASGSESSSDVRTRVQAARGRQVARFASLSGVRCNAQVPGSWLDRNVKVGREARRTLLKAADRLKLSARAYHRVLKVALTISDLGEHGEIGKGAILEALRYR